MLTIICDVEGRLSSKEAYRVDLPVGLPVGSVEARVGYVAVLYGVSASTGAGCVAHDVRPPLACHKGQGGKEHGYEDGHRLLVLPQPFLQVDFRHP